MKCLCVRVGKVRCAAPMVNTYTGEQSCGVAESFADAIRSGLDIMRPDGSRLDVDPHAVFEAMEGRLTLKLAPKQRKATAERQAAKATEVTS